jgi:hypothetical protein
VSPRRIGRRSSRRHTRRRLFGGCFIRSRVTVRGTAGGIGAVGYDVSMMMRIVVMGTCLILLLVVVVIVVALRAEKDSIPMVRPRVLDRNSRRSRQGSDAPRTGGNFTAAATATAAATILLRLVVVVLIRRLGRRRIAIVARRNGGGGNRRPWSSLRGSRSSSKETGQVSHGRSVRWVMIMVMVRSTIVVVTSRVKRSSMKNVVIGILKGRQARRKVRLVLRCLVPVTTTITSSCRVVGGGTGRGWGRSRPHHSGSSTPASRATRRWGGAHAGGRQCRAVQ